MTTTVSTRAYRVAEASVYLPAVTGTPFQGRTPSVDRRRAQLQGRTASAAGVGTGIALDRNPIPRGTPMN
jgi:hypothetical protein